jgi:hypothetical protein
MTAYRWIADGVSVNYPTLADVRVRSAPVMDTIEEVLARPKEPEMVTGAQSCRRLLIPFKS